MDAFKTLQDFFTVWVNELWWSMRDRVGALSIIECFQNAWQAAGRKLGDIANTEKLTITETVEAGHAMLGRTAKTEGNTIYVTECPIWDKILAGNLEYALRCEEFICAPFLTGIKEGLGAKEAIVETNLRLAHIARAKIEYKLEQQKSSHALNGKRQKKIADLEKHLNQLSKEPACIFHVK